MSGVIVFLVLVLVLPTMAIWFTDVRRYWLPSWTVFLIARVRLESRIRAALRYRGYEDDSIVPPDAMLSALLVPVVLAAAEVDRHAPKPWRDEHERRYIALACEFERQVIALRYSDAQARSFRSDKEKLQDGERIRSAILSTLRVSEAARNDTQYFERMLAFIDPKTAALVRSLN